MEASKGKAYDLAQLAIIPSIKADRNNYCLTLWYHMYGEHMGSFRVRYVDISLARVNTLFNREGMFISNLACSVFTIFDKDTVNETNIKVSAYKIFYFNCSYEQRPFN